MNSVSLITSLKFDLLWKLNSAGKPKSYVTLHRSATKSITPVRQSTSGNASKLLIDKNMILSVILKHFSIMR